jgi:hypothetical protein
MPLRTVSAQTKLHPLTSPRIVMTVETSSLCAGD